MYLGPCKAEPQSLHIMLHGLGQGRAEGDFLSDAPFFDLLSKCFSSAHAQMGGDKEREVQVNGWFVAIQL